MASNPRGYTAALGEGVYGDLGQIQNELRAHALGCHQVLMLATSPQRTILSLPLGSPPEPSPHLLSASSIIAQSFLPGCVFKPFRGLKKKKKVDEQETQEVYLFLFSFLLYLDFSDADEPFAGKSHFAR